MAFIIKSDVQPNENSNIIQKLVELRKTVTYLQKDAIGPQFQYVSSSAVLGALREKMDELGLMLFPRVVNKKCTVTIDQKGRNNYFTELDIDFTWVDQDSWDQVVIPFYAQGIDLAGEKGVGKALSYAEKYFLLKQFNIATDQDDPDSFQNRIDHSVPRFISKEQINELEGFAREISQLRNVPFDSVLATVNMRSLDKVPVEMYFGVRDQLLMMLNGARLHSQSQGQAAPNTQPANQGNLEGQQGATKQPRQEQATSETGEVRGVFIVHNYTVGVNPQNVPFGKLDVVRKDSGETLTILVKDDQQLISSLNGVEPNTELQLAMNMQNGFYFLQSYSGDAGGNAKQNGLKQPEPAQSESNAAPQQTSGTPFRQFILNKVERGVSPSNVPYAKLYVTPSGSQDEFVVFANDPQAFQATEGLQDGTQVNLQIREENGWTFLTSVGAQHAS
ncbi:MULTISPECIES: ERF family protein [Bacillaceae]|uniref:ERF family protein n=1 Tax=Bacillaceae TaxID=186817 RepID=UPI0006947283|nr:ERF family protein [Bacillus rubiinfantis]